MAKSLVIGASGLVGKYIAQTLIEKNIEYLGTCMNQVDGINLPTDISNISNVENAFELSNPQIVYVPAGISGVDVCEISGKARAVNIGGIRNILDVARKYNSRVVFFSSSYVFDGTKNRPYGVYDVPLPLQQYGIHKLTCEKDVLYHKNNLVIRTSSIFGKEKQEKNFAYQVLHAHREGKTFFAYDDQFVNPIHAKILAEIVVELAEIGVCGVQHIAGNEEVTKFEFALDVARVFGISSEMSILPCDSISHPQKAMRPYNGCLEPTVYVNEGYEEMLWRFVNDN